MTKRHHSLFKRTLTGAIQEWFIEQDGHRYRAISGHTDGKKFEHEWRVALPTNVGKKNERDGTAQADFEIKAAYKKRLETGYSDDAKKVDSNSFFKPMLAEDYSKNPFELKPNEVYYSQPKLDGHRCIHGKDGGYTRGGKEYKTIEHISKLLEPVFKDYPGLIFDGELYNHIFKDDFNSISSIVKRQKPTDEDLKKAKDLMQYWIYDVVMYEPYIKRFETLSTVLKKYVSSDSIKIIPNHVVKSKEEINERYEQYFSEGFEGQMIRKNGEAYEHRRTRNLLKNKEFDEEEFVIKHIENGKGNRSNIAANVVCFTKNGDEFSAGIMGSHEFCKQVLEEKEEYEGGEVTVKFFRYTPAGIPRFPKAKALFKGPRDS